MEVNPANTAELANIAREIGAEVIEGRLSYPFETGCWLIGTLDLCEHLDTYRGRKVVVIIADCGDADEHPEKYTCGICGFVMNEAGKCPRCKMRVERDARVMDERERRRQELWDEIEEFFNRR